MTRMVKIGRYEGDPLVLAESYDSEVRDDGALVEPITLSPGVWCIYDERIGRPEITPISHTATLTHLR